MNGHCNDCNKDIDINLMCLNHKHICKKCEALRIKEWRRKNPDASRQINLKSRLKNSDRIKEKRRKKYLLGEPRNPNTAQVNKLWRIKNKEKVNAKAAVLRAVKAGIITRPKNCSYCQSEISIVAHHPDYTKRLDVIWLCQSCHRRLHSPHHHSIQDTVPH